MDISLIVKPETLINFWWLFTAFMSSVIWIATRWFSDRPVTIGFLLMVAAIAILTGPIFFVIGFVYTGILLGCWAYDRYSIYLDYGLKRGDQKWKLHLH